MQRMVIWNPEKQELILDVFKEHSIGKNQVLILNTLLGKMWTWNCKHQDNFKAALKGLVHNGCLKESNETLTLLEKGYGHLFEGYTLNDTVEKIKEWIASRKIGRNDFIPIKILFLTNRTGKVSMRTTLRTRFSKWKRTSS